MYKKGTFFCIALTGCLLSQQLLALDLKARKWGMTSMTSSMPMMPQPMEEYEEQCMAADFDPVADMQEAMAQMGAQCVIEVMGDSASAYAADISCPVPGMGEMSGSLSFKVNGEAATGDSRIKVNVNGQSMEIASSISAEYLGACD